VFGTLVDGQEDALVLTLRPYPGLHGSPTLRVVRVVLGPDLGAAGHRQLMAPDLLQALLAGAHDDQLLALYPTPDLLAHPARRRRVAH